jgi:hypothetical protein
MSSDIIIFQSPEETEQTVKEHRDIEYEKLLNDFGAQSEYHVENLLEMNDKLSASKSFWVHSNILAILAKQVITYCYPIVNQIPKAYSLMDEQNPEIETKTKDFFVQLQTNQEIHVLLMDELKQFRKIAIPTEIPFRMIGIRIPNILLPHLDYSEIYPVHPLVSDLRSLYISGNYNYELVARNKSNVAPYTHQLLDILRMKSIVFTDVMFENAAQAKEVLERIISQITNFREYHKKFLPFFMKLHKLSVIKSDVYQNIPEKITPIPKELDNLFYYPYVNEAGFKEKLMGEGLWILYNKILKLGTSTQEINHEIQQKKISNKIKRDMVAQAKEVSLKIVDDFRKQSIVNRKFPGKNIKDLKPKEKEIVQKEFEAQMKRLVYMRDPKIHTVVHDFLKSFENINTAIALKTSYDDVQGLLKDPKFSNITLQDIGLCDHYMKHAELLLEGYKTGTIYKARSAFDIREELIKTFTTSETIISEEYYCKICGQLIAVDDTGEVVEFVGETRIDSGHEVDPLNELIYREVSHIMRTFVKFKTLPPDLRPIIKSLVNTLTPEMHVIETKLKQIQTNISDDMRDLMGMYIYIYTFALVAHMIFVNYGQITFAFREGALGGNAVSKGYENGGKRKTFYRHKVLESDSDAEDEDDSKIIEEIEAKLNSKTEELLVDASESESEKSDNESESEKENLITGGEGGSDENAQQRLSNILANALYLINTTKVKLLKASSNIGPDKVKPILLQAYQWVLRLQTYKETAVSVTNINYEILNSIISSSIYGYLWTAKSIQHPKTKLEDLPAVIGINLDKIKETNYKSHKDKINPFKNAQLVSEKDWKKSGYAPYDEYTYRSYLQSAAYEREERYRAHITPLEEPLVKHYEEAKKLLKIEQRLRFQSRFIENARTFNNIPRIFEYTPAQDIKFNIGRYYRPDGSKRKWDVMVLALKDKTKASETKELNIDELKKLDYDVRKSLKIIDRKDDKDYLSDVKDYSQIVNQQFKKTDYNKSLLEYFENRCPESGIHEFENSDICTKCSRDMNHAWIHDPKSENYIKKYSPAFNKHNNLKTNLVKFNLNRLLKSIEVYEFKFNKFEPWVYSEVQLLEWSRVNPKVNLNMILNLGCSEHRKYHLIEKERENPIKLYENIDHLGRINKLDSYYNSIIRDYYAVKNYQLAEMPPLFYKELIEKFKNELPKLPELKDYEYDKKIEWYKIAHSNEANLICNFILVQISNIIIHLSKNDLHGKAFAELLTISLIAKDKMFSKPDPFKFTIDKRTKDDEYASDTNSEGSDITDAIDVESVGSFEAESDTNEQKQETEAYNFGLEETGIDDVNDGNDDEEGSSVEAAGE